MTDAASFPSPVTARDRAPVNLFGLDRRSIDGLFDQLGERRYRTAQLMKWLYRSRVHEVLANPAYAGDYYFNRIEGKTGRHKNQGEWVRLAV